MNLEKLTIKSQEAFKHALDLTKKMASRGATCAPSVGIAYGRGIVTDILERLKADADGLIIKVKEAIEALPKIKSDSAEVFLSNELNKALLAADEERRILQDEFIAIEHLFLGLYGRKHFYRII